MREHIFQGGKSKSFCTHVPRNKHTISVHLERGHIQRIRVYEDGKSKCVRVCDTHEHRLVIHKIAYLFPHSGTIFTMYCWVLLLQTFLTSNIQYGERCFFRSFSRSQLSVWQLWKPIDIEWVETRCYERPNAIFLRLHRSIKSSFTCSAHSSFGACIVYRTIWLNMTFATWIFFCGQNSRDIWTNKNIQRRWYFIFFCTRMRSWYAADWMNFDETSEQHLFFILCYRRGSTLLYCTGSKRV